MTSAGLVYTNGVGVAFCLVKIVGDGRLELGEARTLAAHDRSADR
jgi:hypothetical protein